MAELHPQPGLTQLDALLAQVRVAGLPVELVVTGAMPDLSSGVQLAVFRVVQEALNNTRKHAEPGASARVVLAFGRDSVEVTVLDDGIKAPVARAGAAADAGGYGGHGISGMRERVAAFGGELEAGPRQTGRGWRVHARVPVGATSTATTSASTSDAGPASVGDAA